jgi:DDE superfamily endonuclease
MLGDTLALGCYRQDHAVVNLLEMRLHRHGTIGRRSCCAALAFFQRFDALLSLGVKLMSTLNLRTKDGSEHKLLDVVQYKFQSAGLAYEIGLSLTSNDIVWINRPFKASVGDLTIFKDRGLADMMGPNQKVVADRGYLGAGPVYEEKLAIRNQQDSIEIREFKKRARARHENLNARMKMFEILQTVFRHDHSKHVASTSGQAINNSPQLLLAQHPNYLVLLGHHSVVADDELLLVVAAVADGTAAFGRIQLFSSATCCCRYNDNDNNNNNNNNQPHLLLA